MDSVIIDEFIKDERIQKYGAKAFFCRKNNIYQSSLSLVLSGKQKNSKIHDIISDYLKWTEDEKTLFFYDFVEKKRKIRTQGTFKLLNPLLTTDESGITLKKEVECRLT
jgi:hypothetical protein